MVGTESVESPEWARIGSMELAKMFIDNRTQEDVVKALGEIEFIFFNELEQYVQESIYDVDFNNTLTAAEKGEDYDSYEFFERKYDVLDKYARNYRFLSGGYNERYSSLDGRSVTYVINKWIQSELSHIWDVLFYTNRIRTI